MSPRAPLYAQLFSAVGHLYVHFFTAFYFVIVLALESEWRLPYHELIGLWSVGALMVGIGALPAGWLGDRWSATGMMSIYFLGLGAASIWCGFADGPAALIVGLGALGLFASIYHPVGIAWLVRSSVSRGKALGFNGIFGGVGVAVAGLVAGALIDLFSWRAAFIVPGVICILTGLAFIVAVRLRLVVEGEELVRKEAPPARGDTLRAYAVLVFTMVVVALLFQVAQTALPKVFDLRLRDVAGEGAFGIGAMVSAVFAVGGAMQIVGGYLADRYPLKLVYLGSLFVEVPLVLTVAWIGGVPLLSAAMLMVMLATAALPAENLLLARYTPANHHSLAYGIKFVLTFGSAPVAIWLVSLSQAATGEFTWLFTGIGAAAFAAGCAALLLPSDRAGRAAARSGPAIQPAE